MSNVDRTSNAVIGHLSGVSLLVPVRTTANVDRARKAVIANATVVRPLVSVRPTTRVTSERIVVGEFVCHTVFGAAELL